MTHLLLAVTAHGYGHLAQSAPVVEAIGRRIPGLEVTLLGDVDPAFARLRLPPGFRHVPLRTDPGLQMDGPLRPLWEQSLADYLRFETEYDERLRELTGLLGRLKPDLVLADVPWLPLDAARCLGIPAAALCSLSWYDILRESPLADRVPDTILGHMREVYASADLFIRPAPSMPMDWLENARDVGPIALRAPDRSDWLRGKLGIAPQRPIVLIQFGGFGGPDLMRDWPAQTRFQWLVPGSASNGRDDVRALAAHGIRMLDVLGSTDLWISKPGYGTYAEAACNGVPLLHVPRPDWPEAPHLNRWIANRVAAAEIALPDLLAGRVDEPIERLLASPRPAATEPTGIDESAEHLLALLR